MLSLLLVTAVVWMAHYQRWTWTDWQLPTDYIGDAHETLARLQAASEGDTWPLTHQRIARLGAPFGALWNAYPTPDKPLMLLLGGIAALIGLMPAANFGLLLAQLTAAAAFYYVARRLRCAWEWAWAGALLFAYSYPSFHRGLAHFSFVFTWTIPLGLLAVWLVAGRRSLAGRRGAIAFCLGIAAVLGAHNPYHTIFWLQLMGWALVFGWLGHRPRFNQAVGLAAVAVAIGVFLIMHAENWLFIQDTEAQPLLARNYGGTERYALKVVEMFIPPADHRLDMLAFFGHRYGRWAEWRGEAFLPYVGVVGIAGLILLALETLRRLARRQPLPGASLSVSWFVAYASIGGITNLLAFFFTFQLFRATNRVSIFIIALVLLFLMSRLSRWTVGWSPRGRAGVAVILALVGLFDQVPVTTGVLSAAEIATLVDSDRDFSTRLEAALPAGAMVYQLPVLGFPEVVPPHHLSDYEHFRPYFFTAELRFSYGAAKLRARSRWQRDLENVDAATLVRRLESYGFGAVVINRRGYEDRAARLLGALEKMGYERRIAGRAGHQVAVLLHPRTPPILPLARTFNYGRGWHPPSESGIRWAFEPAAVSYFNPYAQPLALDFAFRLAVPSPRTVRLLLGERELGRWRLEKDSDIIHLHGVTVRPGIASFRFEADQPAERTSNRRYALRSFGLQNVAITAKPEALPPAPPAAPVAPPRK